MNTPMPFASMLPQVSDILEELKETAISEDDAIEQEIAELIEDLGGDDDLDDDDSDEGDDDSGDDGDDE